MIIKLMTWFIKLQNRFNESRLFKILMIYVLNWVNDLTSWYSLWQWFNKDLAVYLLNLCKVLLSWRFWKIIKLSHLLHKWCFIYVY